MLTRFLLSGFSRGSFCRRHRRSPRNNPRACLEEIIVTAEYRPVSVQELPTSVTVFGQQAIERRGAVHLEQLLNLAPNVNFSTRRLARAASC